MQSLNLAETRRVLVLGTGELGKSVLESLAALPAMKVSVLVRPVYESSHDKEKVDLVEWLKKLGIEIIYGDAADDSTETLARQFSQFDTLVSCLGFAAGPGIQVKLTEAALQSSLVRYIPWQFGVDYDAIGYGSPQPLFDEQLDVRQMLRAQSRLQWQLISTGMFTSFLFEPALGVVDIENSTVRALGDWETTVTVTTPEDIGRLTARIVAEPVGEPIIFCAGDTVTYGQLADTVENLVGRTMRREQWSVLYLKAELANNPSDAMRKYRAVFAEGTGVAWEKEHTYNVAHGIQTSTIAQWAQQHLQACCLQR